LRFDNCLLNEDDDDDDDDDDEQVTSFKLLGVTVTDSLRRGDRVATITAKASKRLWS